MNFNTFLLAVVIAVMGWVGYETTQAGKAVASLQTEHVHMREAYSDLRASIEKIDGRLANAVTRADFDSKVLSIETKLREIDVELLKLKRVRPIQQ